MFDAFQTNWPLAARAQKLGNDSAPAPVAGNGMGLIKYSAGQQPLVLDVDAGQNYEAARVITDRDRKAIYIPMIQSSWLEQIRGAARINKDLGSGTVVGFVQGVAPFEAAMDEQSVGANSKLIYFNRRGEVTKDNFGEPGGGFIVFNVPQGQRSIMVQAKGMSKSFAATVQVESRVTNVINHWMR